MKMQMRLTPIGIESVIVELAPGNGDFYPSAVVHIDNFHGGNHEIYNRLDAGETLIVEGDLEIVEQN
jgi:hypothetical protein